MCSRVMLQVVKRKTNSKLRDKPGYNDLYNKCVIDETNKKRLRSSNRN